MTFQPPWRGPGEVLLLWYADGPAWVGFKVLDPRTCLDALSRFRDRTAGVRRMCVAVDDVNWRWQRHELDCDGFVRVRF